MSKVGVWHIQPGGPVKLRGKMDQPAAGLDELFLDIRDGAGGKNGR